MRLLISIVNASNNTKSVLLGNLINLHSNKYSDKCRYYAFAVKLDKCIRSCNNLGDLFNKLCVPKKTEDLNV